MLLGAIPLCYFIFNTVLYSVLTQHQYTINNNLFWPDVSVLQNHLHASIYSYEVHSVSTWIIGSHSVYINSYQFKILISSLKSIDRMDFLNTNVNIPISAKVLYWLYDVVLSLNKQLYWTHTTISWTIKYCCVWLKTNIYYCFLINILLFIHDPDTPCFLFQITYGDVSCAVGVECI